MKKIIGTYVSVKVKNSKEVYDWFKKQGIEVLNSDDLHSTISYSRKEFEREPNTDEIIISKDNLIGIEQLGDEGAYVLKFNSDELTKRFNECMEAGATYDYDTYIPHMTITYNGKGVYFEKVNIPDFDIILNNETVEPLDLEWKDKLNTDAKTIKYEICPDSGFMRVSGICARSGIQEYLGSELGLQGDDATRVIKVYRPEDEVVASLSSYNGSIITDNHPDDGIVTTDSYKVLTRGNVSEAISKKINEETYIIAKATITDPDLIENIKNGKRELSAGYTRDLVKESGEYNGESYDYTQRNIRVNHVAVVDEGRCGNACKLNLDKKGVTTMIKIQVDGRSVSMDEAELTKYVTELQKSKDEAMEKVEEAEKKTQDAESSKEELAKMIEDKTAELLALQEQLTGMVTMEEAEEMASESVEISEDAEELEIETKEKSNDAKRKEILKAITGDKHSFDSFDKATLKTVYRISVDQAKVAKKLQKDGYKGVENDNKATPRTGNLSNDLNAIAAEARKNRGVK